MVYEQFKKNIDNLIGYLSNPYRTIPTSTIALAVSGGADSTALLMLAHSWAQSKDVRLVVISVDHHLRYDSKFENEYVRDLSYELGYQHYQLHFYPKNNFSNLQARAREARYRLMSELCIKLDILTIFTAHHLNDYIENYCIRSEKKSSIFGLSTNYITWYNNIRIIRPLFNIPKQQLVEYLVTNNIKWFEDSSNLSGKYRRNVIRKKLNIDGNDKKAQLIKEQLIINNQVEEKLKPEFIACIAETVIIYNYGFASINLLKFTKFSKEIKLQTISFVLIIISGKNYNCRTISIDRINELLQQAVSFTKTLHGCIIKKINNNLIIYREFGREGPRGVTLNNGCRWDNRFLVNINEANIKNREENYFIDQITQKDYSEIKNNLSLQTLKTLSFNHHIPILFTMPTIKLLEKVIAIPLISYYNDESLGKKISVYFYPSFVSRFTHF